MFKLSLISCKDARKCIFQFTSDHLLLHLHIRFLEINCAKIIIVLNYEIMQPLINQDFALLEAICTDNFVSYI